MYKVLVSVIYQQETAGATLNYLLLLKMLNYVLLKGYRQR